MTELKAVGQSQLILLPNNLIDGHVSFFISFERPLKKSKYSSWLANAIFLSINRIANLKVENATVETLKNMV